VEGEIMSVAIVVPTLDIELHEENARAAVMRSGISQQEDTLFMAQDGEPLQRYTRTVNRGLREAIETEWRTSAYYGRDMQLHYICLMNDDTVPGDNWLAELVWCMEQDETLGYVAPAQPCRTEGMEQARGPESEPQIREIFAVPFGCVLIRREVFTDVGLLDPTFVHYCSDTDHQYRAKAFGWRSAWAPHVWVDRENHGWRLPQQLYQDRAAFYTRWAHGTPEIGGREQDGRRGVCGTP